MQMFNGKNQLSNVKFRLVLRECNLSGKMETQVTTGTII